jgi:hypothetical protein
MRNTRKKRADRGIHDVTTTGRNAIQVEHQILKVTKSITGESHDTQTKRVTSNMNKHQRNVDREEIDRSERQEVSLTTGKSLPMIIEFSPSLISQGNGNPQSESASSDTETNKDLTNHAGNDLLEDIFGPRPPETASDDVQTKGRGTLSSATMDARFAEDYDPSMEIQLDTDQNELEAMRDRQQWRLRGADRLRAAGFSEDVIKIWQNSGEKQERNVEDVKWTKQGEAREWDRGKQVDEQGNVDLKPKWKD